MALNLKQQKFIQENQDLYNEILGKVPNFRIENRQEEHYIYHLVENFSKTSKEEFLQQISDLIPSEAEKIWFSSDFYDGNEDLHLCWSYENRVILTEQERKYEAYLELEKAIRMKNIRENEERFKESLRSSREKKERAEYERLKKKFEGQ